MHWRYSLAHLILASVVVLGLTPLMVSAAPQAQIAFSSERDGNKEIYVMDADGRNQRRLTKNRHQDWEPSWSPDGKRIVFASPRAGNKKIYVMNANGARHIGRLTKDRGENSDPAWFDPAFAVEVAPFAVAPAGKKLTMWGWLKQVAR